MHPFGHRNTSHAAFVVCVLVCASACDGTLDAGSTQKQQDGGMMAEPDGGGTPRDATSGGDEDSGPLPLPDGRIGEGSTVRLFVGGHSSCASISGELYCWGDNEYGQLGVGEDPVDPTRPAPAVGPALVQFDLGRWTSCGLDAEGGAWCSGQGGVGQTGPGETTDAFTPRRIEGLAPMRQVAVADRASCAVDAVGRVFCWGRNDHGILTGGTEPQGPTQITSLSNVQTLALGEYHACAIRTDGRLLCWGENTRGRVGAGGEGLVTPTDVGLAEIVQASLSEAHTCAVSAAGEVYCWGDDWAGQVGLGEGTAPDSCGGARCKRTPARVDIDGEATRVVAGDGFSCALLRDGTVDCWGRGVGEIGVGLTGVTEIAAGGRSLHMCARIGDVFDDVRCWGQNDDGEIGDGTRVSRDAPTPVLLP